MGERKRRRRRGVKRKSKGRRGRKEREGKRKRGCEEERKRERAGREGGGRKEKRKKERKEGRVWLSSQAFHPQTGLGQWDGVFYGAKIM